MRNTHDFTHDGAKKGKRDAGSIARPRKKLPLLGSNQDSSDPESGEKATSIDRTGSDSRQNRPEARPETPENTHDSTPGIRGRFGIVAMRPGCQCGLCRGLRGEASVDFRTLDENRRRAGFGPAL